MDAPHSGLLVAFRNLKNGSILRKLRSCENAARGLDYPLLIILKCFFLEGGLEGETGEISPSRNRRWETIPSRETCFFSKGVILTKFG